MVLIFSVVGCGSSNEDNSTNTPNNPTSTPTQTPVHITPSPTPLHQTIVQSDKHRIVSPEIPASDLKTLADGNTAFALDLYKALSSKDGNFFYSPYSISLALAMTYAGARGETEQQIADTLHFILSQDSLHEAFNALDQELASRGEGAQGKDDEGFRLNIVNAIWGQQDYQFLAQFLDVLAENYGAGLRLLDFIKSPEASRITINDWVSEQTEDRIKDLIPQGAIDEFTRLVLTNAVYFNAAWLHQFNEDATQDGAFYLLDGTKVTVPLMKQNANFGYAKGDGYQTVELPYDGNELSMMILLPDANKFEAFEKQLNTETLNSVIDSLKHPSVDLTMPKFEFESEFNLSEALKAMGMPIAFTPPTTVSGADFSGMDGGRNLYITDVLHKAFVSVDENGTEAAAATAVVVGTTSMPSEVATVTVDHPFIFLIRDIQTGSIVFIGRVLNPAT